MRRSVTYFWLLAGVFVLAATGVSAQKYPERRTTRQGTILYNKGDWAGAEAEYRRALELNPALREAMFNLAAARWRQVQETVGELAGQAQQQGEAGQEPSQAQAAQQQAIEAQAREVADGWGAIAADSLAPVPMVSAANYNLGNVALAGRQIDAAIEAYKQSLRLVPDDMQAKYNLAYAQKLKQQQEQNQDQNKDQNDGGGGGGENDQNQNQDQNNDPQNDGQDGEGDQNKDNGQNDPQNGDGDKDKNDGNGNENNEGNEPPPPSGQAPGEAKIDPRAAQQMLDAMQAAEDDTREKVNAREVQVGARSGKNW